MRKRLFIFSAVLFSSINFSSAQITFQKTFGGTSYEWGFAVQQTTDDGYIITGRTHSYNVGIGDVYLIKTNANGDSLWTKTFGGTGEDDGYSVQQTTDGGYIIAGYTASFGANNGDIYLIKTNANGDSLWTKTLGGVGYDRGNSVQQTTDGGYIVTGITNSFGAGGYDAYLIKTDANGNSLWTKTFGGGNDEAGNSVRQTTDGGYIITGYSTSFGTSSYFAIYLIKTDAIGNLLWSKIFFGANDIEGLSVQQTLDGGYIIGGYGSDFIGATYNQDYLIKTNANGDTLWTKSFGGTQDYWAGSVRQTMDGGYIIAGYTGSPAVNTNVCLIKTNINGDTLWTKTFGGSNRDEASYAQQTTDGGYILAGVTYNFGAGNADIYFIKTDSIGNNGCNEVNTTTIVGIPITHVSSPATIETSPATIETSPATIVGSGGTVNTLCTTVGENEIVLHNSLIISPNPSAGNFIISYEGTIMKGTIEILNILGENVYTGNIFNESRKEINLKNISSGIYFVKMFDGEKYFCEKIIIAQN